ncbi:hypothetical protein JCM19314_3586 [Nonlabens ulvanivorans]|uniref:Uncharacterized protein n=1 Tax=Nonlabens ulvanivorans TaxID=906888 RepID=A0A090QVT1_NONUL|nr:hypothetical protein JCM19314_3586 [Nonlabens ulvanivorans]
MLNPSGFLSHKMPYLIKLYPAMAEQNKKYNIQKEHIIHRRYYKQ